MDTRIRVVIGLLAIVCLAAPSAGASLSDIADSSHKEAIEYLHDNGIIEGYPDGTFRPEDTVNRAELLKILVGSLGIVPDAELHKDCFPDVTNQWFAPYVCFAKEKEWVAGYPDGTFQGWKTVNTVEAIKMIIVAIGQPLSDSGTSAYSDVDVSSWYAPYVGAAVHAGILADTSALGVGNNMTRGDVSEILYKAMSKGAVAEEERNELLPESLSSSSSSAPRRHRNGEALDEVQYSSSASVSSHSISQPGISFDAISKKYGDSDFILSPVSPSRGKFTYTSNNPFVASINGNVVTIKGAGIATITAVQDADGDYGIGLATSVLTVNRVAPTIVFEDMYKHVGEGGFALRPTSNSSGIFTFTYSGSTVGTAAGDITTVTAGTTQVTATQAAYGNYTEGTATAKLIVTQ